MTRIADPDEYGPKGGGWIAERPKDPINSIYVSSWVLTADDGHPILLSVCHTRDVPGVDVGLSQKVDKKTSHVLIIAKTAEPRDVQSILEEAKKQDCQLPAFLRFILMLEELPSDEAAARILRQAVHEYLEGRIDYDDPGGWARFIAEACRQSKSTLLN